MKKGMPKIVLQGYEELDFLKRRDLKKPRLWSYDQRLYYDLWNMPYN